MQPENDLPQGLGSGPTFSEKCSLRESCSIWAALPGAQNPDGSSPPRKGDAYDSESLSALKSNMGDREIVFFSVADYL